MFAADQVIEIKGKYYSVSYFTPKNKKVPAIRMGYNRDEVDKGTDFVSVFHPVIGFLKKTLKIDSELDLSCAMVAFPQRFAYVSPCKNQGCKDGMMLDGSVCPVCNGTGVDPFHKGTQDVVTLSMPRNKEEMIDLENMLVYKSPPIELLQFQKDYLEYLKKSVHAMMFNADLYTRSEVIHNSHRRKSLRQITSMTRFTALHSIIQPPWEFVVNDIATYTDLAGVYPSV